MCIKHKDEGPYLHGDMPLCSHMNAQKTVIVIACKRLVSIGQIATSPTGPRPDLEDR